MLNNLKFLALVIALAAPVATELKAADLATPEAASVKGDNKISGQMNDARKLADEAIAKHPMFAVLIEDNPKFRDTWEAKIAIGAIALPKGKKDKLAVESGLALALNESDFYLPRADDKSVNDYISGLAHIMLMGANDEMICLQMLPGEKPELSAQQEADLEARFAPELFARLYSGVSSVIISGQHGVISILKKEEVDSAIMPVVMGMAKKHGEEAITGLSKFSDKSLPATKRCQIMGWMMESILELPEKDRAVLSRTMFSKTSRETVDAN